MKNNKIFRSIVTILLIINIISFIDISVFQNEACAVAKNEIRQRSFNMGSDIIFKGVFSSHSLYFDLDKNMILDSAEININFSITQLVDDKKDATITFLLNGTPFYSSRLVYKPSEQIQNIKAQVPLRLIKEGSNELKMSAYCRISDKPCTDDVNNANWLVINDNSNILIKFKDKETSSYISDFPYPFIKTNEVQENNTVIAIPDDCEESELTAAFILQAYLGKLHKYEDYNGIIVKYSKIPKDKDIIYLGGTKDLPNEIKSLYKEIEKENLKENAIITKNKSPFNSDNIIMSVVSDNEEMLLKSVRLLSNKEIVSQLNVDTFRVHKDIKEETLITEPKVKLTFTDMGIGDMNLKGSFRQSGSAAYMLPRNKAISSGAKVKLNVRYSENLDFNRSLLTVFVNGVPIGSKKLEKDKCNGDEIELPIPTDIKVSNYIDIKVAFDLEIPNSYCEFRQEEMPWAFVSKDSFIYLPNSNIKSFIFDVYSNPFIADRKFNNMAVVIPDSLTQGELEGLSRMLSYIGRDIEYNNGILKVVKSSNFSEQYHNMNLIIYGTPDKNKVIKDINSQLWFKYKEGFQEFESNEKLYLTQPYSSNISNFQFDVSPYNSKNAMLVLTSPKTELITKALKYLYSSKEILKMRGDCVLIDEYGNLRIFKFKKDEPKFDYDKIKLADKTVKVFSGFVGLFLLFVITAAILYYLKDRRFSGIKNKKKDKKKDKYKDKNTGKNTNK